MEEKFYYLAFNVFNSGIGPARFKLLVDYFGSAEKAYKAPEKELRAISLPEKILLAFLEFRKKFDPEKYLTELAKKEISFLTIKEKDYPESLKQISDPPFILYVKGKILPEDNLSIAVVGTRKITGYGRQVTEKIAGDLSVNGLTIVSGLARGVDTVAHTSALQYGGRTIAVLGCGIDIIYPAENVRLYHEIADGHGAVLSEFPLGMITGRGTFPARNRIISGLSLGVVVTEGAEDSGSLITASYAAEQGREVFAVPGPITSSLSKGPADLIKKGAKLVYEVKDILEELNLKQKTLAVKAREIIPENKDERIILEFLKNESLHIDELAKKSGMEIAKLTGLLTMMEIKGKVRNLGNMNYSQGC